MQNTTRNRTLGTVSTLQLNHEAIAVFAAQLWEQEGRPAGRDVEIWLRAEQQLLAAGRRQADRTALRIVSEANYKRQNR